MQSSRHLLFTDDARFDVTPADLSRPTTLTGYALIWNVLSSDRGGFKVRLLPRSAKFARIVHALFHHNYADVIGSTANGTLRLFTDDVGVKVEIDLPDTTAGRDVAELVRKGYVRGMSFAMTTDPTSRRVTEGGQSILEASAYVVDEVTVTAIPAFVETVVNVRADDLSPALPAFAANAAADRHRLDRLSLQNLRPTSAVPTRRATTN